MRFLIDTSAWIEFFKPRGHPQVKRHVAAALAEGLVVTASPVVVELLAGLDERLPAHVAAVERIRAMELLDASWEAGTHSGSHDRRDRPRLGLRGLACGRPALRLDRAGRWSKAA